MLQELFSGLKATFSASAQTELRGQLNRCRRVSMLAGNIVSNSRTDISGVSARVYKNGTYGFSSIAEYSDEAARAVLQAASENADFMDLHAGRGLPSLPPLGKKHFPLTQDIRDVPQSAYIDFLRALDAYMKEHCPGLISRSLSATEDSMEKMLLTSDSMDAHTILPRSYCYLIMTAETPDGAPVELLQAVGGEGTFDLNFTDPALIYPQIDQLYDRIMHKREGVYADAGKKTVPEVEEEIEKTVENYSLKLSFRDNRTETIDGDAIDYQYVSDGGVQKLLDEQNIYTWIGGALFGSEKSYTVGEDTKFDEQKLVEGLSNLPEMKSENQAAPTDAYLLLDETTKRYNIVPETEGNVLNVEAVQAHAKSAVSGSVETVDLAREADTYAAPAIRATDESLNSQQAALNTFLSTSITYTLPEGTQVLDANVLDGWISMDENGYRYVDEEHIAECVDQYVKDLAAAVDVEKETTTFASTNRGMVEVDNDEFVIQIDQDAEKEQLLGEVLATAVTQREPVYSRKDEAQDPTFGGTYVEIDIENQMVYYYEDGQCLVETPCVTGTGSVPRRSTPTGVFHIYDKQRSRTLYGDIQADGSYGYASFVNYWMRFCGGCGLHDATWRDSFGGDIYWDSGSHGCVNLPYEAAAQMYEIVEEGTPCIVF